MSFITRVSIVIGLLIVIVAGACLLFVYSHQRNLSFTSTNPQEYTAASDAYDFATVNGITFEIATTTSKQDQGLSYRNVIPDNYAMLFVFSQDGTPGFWMIHMLEPLDMIWLSDNGTIVSITHNALPSSYPNVFYPPSPIRYVLETRVGLAAEKDWTVGTRIPLPLPYGE